MHATSGDMPSTLQVRFINFVHKQNVGQQNDADMYPVSGRGADLTRRTQRSVRGIFFTLRLVRDAITGEELI
jgi:hypothetical protein